jgi:hypothetical protein
MESEYLEALIDDLIFFIDHHDKFNGKVVDAIIYKYRNSENITAKELSVLQNIHETWKVREYIEIKQYKELVDYEQHI